MKLPSTISQSLLAGTFILGIGTGVTVDSQINTNPRDLASRDAVEHQLWHSINEYLLVSIHLMYT
jgi:hypothetical protein